MAEIRFSNNAVELEEGQPVILSVGGNKHTLAPSFVEGEMYKFRAEQRDNGNTDIYWDGSLVVSDINISDEIGKLELYGYAGNNSAATTTVWVDHVELPPLPPGNPSATAQSTDQIDITYESVTSDGTPTYDLYRATSSGTTLADYTTALSGTTTTFTDTGRTESTRYHYRLTATDDSGLRSRPSVEVDEATVVPAPSDLNTTPGTRELANTWTNNASNADGFRVRVSTDDGSTWTQVGEDLPPDTTNYTATDLLDGTDYLIEVVAFGDGRESTPVSASETTEFAVITGLNADASVEDALTALWDDTANVGEYRVQHRVTNSGDQFTDDGTVSHKTTQLTITHLLDGEEYDIRLRHETDDGTGSWTEISPVTLLPTPGASVVSVSKTSVDIDISDNADNEDNYTIERAEKRLGQFSNYQYLSTESAGLAIFTDETPRPGTEYRYRISAVTEHVTASTTVETATTATAFPDRVPQRGWYVEIDHPSGATLRPRIIEQGSVQPRRLPTLNGLPRVEIPVPRDGKWDAKQLELAPCRVWKDGIRQPIEEMTKPRQTPEATILTARGGRELLDRVEESVTEQEAHNFIEGLIDTTGLQANVDAPDADITTDTPMLSADTDQDIISALMGAPFEDTSPLDISSGTLRTHDVAYFRSAPDFDRLLGSSSNHAVIESGIFGSGEAIRIDSIGNQFYYDFDVEYELSNAVVAVRVFIPDETHSGFDIALDGTVIQTVNPDTPPTPLGEVWWIDDEVVGSVSPGSHTLSVYFNDGSSGDGSLSFGSVALFDESYTTVANESFNDGRPLSTPHRKPPSIDVETNDVTTVKQVVGGRLEASVNSTARNQALAVSNDQGQNWVEASNGTVVDGAFDSGSPRLRGRFTLSSFDSGSGDLAYDAGTEVDLFDLFADLDDTPLIVNRVFDEGRMIDVFNEVAERGDFIWCVTTDQHGTLSVEWTQPGQREASGDPTVVDYSVETDAGQITEKAVVYGTSQPVRGEEITADVGVAVSLPDDHLQSTGEIVRATDGTRYERGSDYEFDPLEGTVTVRAGGDIDNGDTLVVDYQARTRGTYELPSFDGDETKTVVETIPGVTTGRSADQAALTIVQQTSTPLKTATITIDRFDAGWDLVDQLSIPGVPGPAMEPWSITDENGQIKTQLGSRDRVEEVVSRLKTRLSAVTREI
ncbi:fibronectin type III domain-containing protein [Haloferax mucosum ATCC BAA-1512]|uniref:Fibronectin type III domain-containing protein n=1 Tax=Haloferax mucosum ATCC BAA-1512 TaxID=662479 RepID=M0IJP6_9EURY|nr:fibronectin type III domain-containing protein [Haloferax mucosum]ELZ96063.1 fibronectin type III domain-containing protein [Haloferax mucosum ATCC BAA-1512]